MLRHPAEIGVLHTCSRRVQTARAATQKLCNAAETVEVNTLPRVTPISFTAFTHIHLRMEVEHTQYNQTVVLAR